MPAKYELNAAIVKKYIDLHIALKIPFEMTVSNYATKIKSRLYDIHFMKNAQSNRMFAGFQKVKNEVTKKEIPNVQPDRVNYFATNIFEKDFFADTIFNIDLKAAYATILLNDGFISKETHKYLMSLPKMERLAAVGMLAGKKNVFKIDENGKPVEEYTIISPTSNYFFYCVNRTSEIMNEARSLLMESFLFSWVDGIYFLDAEEKNYSELMEYFKANNFKVSFEVLNDFFVQVKKTYYKATYKKEGKLKAMNVPKTEQNLIRDISSYLLLKQYN